MTQEIPIGLVACDIDNTISEYFNLWAHCIGPAIEAVAKNHGYDVTDEAQMDAIYASILAGASVTKTGARFHDFARMIRETPMFDLNLIPEEKRREVEKMDAKAAHDFQRNYAAGKTLEPGVIEVVKELHKRGVPFVLYTDSPEDGAIRSLVHSGFPIDLLDGLVCRANDADEILPNGQKAPMQIDGGAISECKKKLKEQLGDNYVVNEGNVWKPNREVMEGIMKRYGIEDPSEVVMIGDNIKSDGGFVGMGVRYAWQAQGSEVDDYTAQMNAKLSEKKDYKLGRQAHLDQLAELGATDPALAAAYKEKMVTLGNGFADFFKYFTTKDSKSHKIEQIEQYKEQYKETVRQQKEATSAKTTLVVANLAKKSR